MQLAVLLVLLFGIALARLAGVAGISFLNSWPSATRTGLAAMLLFTSVGHFSAVRYDLVRIVPPALPYPMLLIYFTGLCEIAGAFGLLFPLTRFAAAVALLLFFLAVLPANIYAVQSGATLGGELAVGLTIRLPIQIFFLALTYWAGIYAARR